jgi:Transposase
MTDRGQIARIRPVPRPFGLADAGPRFQGTDPLSEHMSKVTRIEFSVITSWCNHLIVTPTVGFEEKISTAVAAPGRCENLCGGTADEVFCGLPTMTAQQLLEVLLQHRNKLRRLSPDSEATRRVQHLVEERRNLVDEKTAQSNRLTNHLKMYFPQMLNV